LREVPETMDYEAEVNELKARVATLEKRLDDLHAEVKTLYTQMERESTGLRL